MFDFLFAVLPLALLVYWMTRREGLPSNRALPLAALALYGILLFWFRRDPLLVHAALVDGVLTAATPVLIVFGAVLLFKTMEHSGSMVTVRAWLDGVTSNRVAQLMVVGWAFSFLIEGVSGFGTPAALAAPLLVGLGFPALPVVVLCLMMNTVPVSFGAVGMPTWFGLGGLGLGEAELRQIGLKSAILHASAGLFLPLIALRVVVPWAEIRANLSYIALVVGATVAAYVATAAASLEFPSIVGGAVALGVAVAAARHGIGLQTGPRAAVSGRSEKIGAARLIKAAFPLWGTVLVLLATRLDALGLKGWLTGGAPLVEWRMGGLGEFRLSASLVMGWRDIFGTGVTWTHSTLYVPSLLPFVAISVLAFWVDRTPRPAVAAAWRESLARVWKPIGAFVGALVLVKLLTVGGEDSVARVIGQGLAAGVGDGWQFAAVYLGALGSFFSGSNTVSNLTFGGIQLETARELGLSATTILALQSVGGAMGNMVCIHNIVAACSVVGLVGKESEILRKTIVPVLLYGAVAGVVALVW